MTFLVLFLYLAGWRLEDQISCTLILSVVPSVIGATPILLK